MKRSSTFVLYASLFYFLLSGCAFDLAHVTQVPTQLNLSQSPKSSWQLMDDVPVSPGTGYSRTLRKGTKWVHSGSIEYGDVFKTSDQVLTVEASNIYEAYIVVSGDDVVGFYLPVEKTYSPLSSPKKLQIKPTN